MTPQAVGAIIIGAGFNAVAAAFLGSPVGAAGGAIFGATRVVVDLSIDAIFKEIISIPLVALSFACISFLGAWKLAGVCGASMSLKSAVVLSLTSTALLLGTSLVIAAIFLASRHMREVQ
jgi:hypothetical protein